MNIERWKLLMDDNGTELTDDEISAGWHFCNDFDGLLVGPGMDEYQICECKGKPPAAISCGQQSVESNTKEKLRELRNRIEVTKEGVILKP